MTEPTVKISYPLAKQKRNWAIGIGLILFVVIVYVVTLVKINIHGVVP